MDSQTDEQRSSGEKVGEVKIEQFWRDATAKDTTSGKHLASRFRDYPNGGWADNRTLAGWRRIAGEPSLLFYDDAGVAWTHCQVYDPPQWWLDKPDPGEGWRLLASGEKLLESDQFFNSVGDWVGACLKWSGGFVQDGLFYRRRIEPENPKIPSSCDETPNSSHLGQIIEVRNYVDAAWERAELEALFPKSEFAFVARVEKNTRDFPTNWRFGRLVQAGCNSPEKSDSSRSKDNIPTGWQKIPDDEPRLASDAYWSLGAKDWIIIGDARLEWANSEKWPAIRRVESQISMKLTADCCYTLPSGHSICVTEKGFEVLLCHGRT